MPDFWETDTVVSDSTDRADWWKDDPNASTPQQPEPKRLSDFLNETPLEVPPVKPIYTPQAAEQLPKPKFEAEYKQLNALYRATKEVLHPDDIDKRKQLDAAYEGSLKQLGIEPIHLEKFREGEFIPKVSTEDLTTLGVPDFVAKLGAGTQQAVAGAIDGMLQNPELFGLPWMPKPAQRAFLGAFAGQMAVESDKLLIDFKDAVANKDWERASRDLAGTVIGGAFLKMIGGELMGKAGANRTAGEAGRQLATLVADQKLVDPDLIARNLATPGTVRATEQTALSAPEATPPTALTVLAPETTKALREISLVQQASPELLETAKLVAQRREELGAGGKLPEGGQDFTRPMAGFEKGAEERLAARTEPTETKPLTEPEAGKPLQDVQALVRDRLEQREWQTAVDELAKLPAEASRTLIDELTGVSREGTPLTAAEGTIFNEIWEASLKRLAGKPETKPPVSETSKTEPDAPKSEPAKGLEAWADQTIAEGQKRLNVGLDPTLLAAYSIKGAAILGRGAKQFTAWSKEMLSDFGESVRPHLRTLWQASQSAASTMAGQAARPQRKGGIIDPYATPMIERLNERGGPVSRKVAAEAKQIDSRAVELAGQISPLIDEARSLSGKAFRGGTTWVRGLDKVTDTAGTGRLHTLEGTDRTAVVNAAPANARKMVGAFWDANVTGIGQLAAQANVGFAPSGKVQRILTPHGMDVVLEGGGTVWQRWADGANAANNKPSGSFERILKTWKAELDKPAPDVARLDRIAQDFHREFPKAITHVKVGPTWIELIESDPVQYLNKASERTARAAAFREVYPANAMGQQYLAATREAVMRELPTNRYKSEFDNLMRVLQGHRLDQGVEQGIASAVGASTPAGIVASEAVGLVSRPLKAGMLSLSAIANAAETVIGGPSAFLKYRHVLPLLLKNPVNFYKQLEMAGMVNRATRNFAFNPTAPLRSISRIISEGLGRVTLNNFFNEVQEYTGAGAARVLADRVRARDLSPSELLDFQSVLRAMGFRDNFRAIAEGRDLGGLAQFEREASPFLSGGHERPATSSRLGNSRAFNTLFWFHRYPQMVLNQARGLLNNLIEDVRSGTRSTENLYRDAKLTARWLGAKTGQGALATLLLTWIKEGNSGVEQRAREARESLTSFLLQITAQAIGGPITLAQRIGERTETSEDAAMELLKASPPVSATMDTVNAIAGMGKYDGLSAFERAAKLLESKTPVSTAAKSIAAMWGLAEGNPKLDTARRAFYRWAVKQGWHWPEGRAKDAAFTQSMRKAVQQMERGSDFSESLQAAIDIKVAKGADPRKAMASSLRGRRILRTPHNEKLTPEQLDALEKWLGTDNLNQLQQRDAMLEAIASALD